VDEHHPTYLTTGVLHCGLAIYIKKYHLKAKEELWKLKYFTMQKYNPQKNPLNETKKSFQISYTLYLISSFNKSQNIIFQNRPTT
jgi:hypothetical protein